MLGGKNLCSFYVSRESIRDVPLLQTKSLKVKVSVYRGGKSKSPGYKFPSAHLAPAHIKGAGVLATAAQSMSSCAAER
jgi:hypothetical protein